MANVINDALNEITAALAEVVPGRTTATPRTEGVGTALWVEIPTLTADRVPGTKYVWADFPVWIVADGADRSQVAYLNDCVAKAVDAISAVGAPTECYFVSARPAPTEPAANRAVVLTVRKLIRGLSFCRPDPPDPSPIPPDPINPIAPDTDPESEED